MNVLTRVGEWIPGYILKKFSLGDLIIGYINDIFVSTKIINNNRANL